MGGMTPPPAVVDIPESAIRALIAAIDPDKATETLSAPDRAEIVAVLQAAAPHLIAAELRRIAGTLDTVADPLSDRFQKGETAGRREVAGLLGGRAAVLDGGA